MNKKSTPRASQIATDEKTAHRAEKENLSHVTAGVGVVVGSAWQELRALLRVPDADVEDGQYTTASGWLFDYLGQKVHAVATSGYGEASITFRAASDQALREILPPENVLEENEYSKNISRWSRGEAAAKNAGCPTVMIEGEKWLRVEDEDTKALGANVIVLFQFLGPRRTGTPGGCTVKIRILQGGKAVPLLPGAPVDEVTADAPAEVNRPLLAAAMQNIELNVKHIERAVPKGALAAEVRSIRRALKQMGLVFLILIGLAACARAAYVFIPLVRQVVDAVIQKVSAPPPAPRPDNRTPRPNVQREQRPMPPASHTPEALYLTMPRALVESVDGSGARIPNTIGVSYEHGTLRLTASPAFARFGVRRVLTTWQRFDVVPPTLIRREDPHEGATWEQSGLVWNRYVYLVTIEAADDSSLRQIDYVGVTLPNPIDGFPTEKFGTFDVSSLIPPGPRVDRRPTP